MLNPPTGTAEKVITWGPESKMVPVDDIDCSDIRSVF